MAKKMPLINFRTSIWAAVLVWTISILGLLIFILYREHVKMTELAKVEAIASIDKDMAYRLWNTNHGGVYVEVTEKTQPNPYLNVPEREVTTPSGRLLTMMNPAYMTREVQTMERELYGTRGHITSLNPLNPMNIADDWEKKMLEGFAAGGGEGGEVELIEGQEYYRYMIPMYVKEGCLKCHAQQGYQLGDLRGGLSVAIPMSQYNNHFAGTVKQLGIGYGFLWLLGLGSMMIAFYRMKQQNDEKEKSQQALRLSEEKFYKAFQFAPMLMTISVMENGQYIDVNEKFLQVSGFTREEAIGKTSVELGWITEEDRQLLKKSFQEKGRVSETELTLRTKTGQEINCLYDGEIIQVEGKTRLLSIAQDITERKAAQRAMQTLNAELENRVLERTSQLESANQELEAFSYSVSHDLRAPLRAISGYSRLLMEDFPEEMSEDTREMLANIRNSALRMDQLITDLLTFSRLNHHQLQKDTVHTRDLVSQVINELAPEYENHQIEWVIGDLPDCEADSHLLRQVYLNLISNAIKYSRPRSLPRVEIGCLHAGGQNVYYVRDNGVGFEMSNAGKLFGVFQRLHSETEFPGTGIGLAVVKRIITRHDGRIWAESEPDKGATFYFTL